MTAKRIVILGATGSIGRNTLDVVAAHPDRFSVTALAAGRNAALMIEQARRFTPDLVAMVDEAAAAAVREALAGSGVRVLSGMDGVIEAAAAEGADMVMSAIVGAAGLRPTIAAARAGRDIALANKECLVMAGRLFMEEIENAGVRLIPVDSEHSAIFQVLDRPESVERIILTASGGPFRGRTREELAGVTPAQAVAHPKWNMGRKISVDSATLMNKGLEVIEACWLFGVGPAKIEVAVHPQSIVHSLVSYVDGSVLAQLGAPDMRTPIAVALAWPERIAAPVEQLDLVRAGELTFFEPDHDAFPCLGLAFEAIRAGGVLPTVLNAANEAAVAAFLEERIGFGAIPALIEAVMARSGKTIPGSIGEILEWDAWARREAEAWMGRSRS